ncbi:MAG: hypothetical protein HY757_02090 [Nitrospirae bacterium]|nr:hypothetical protein [Nitrospirota bacterium]
MLKDKSRILFTENKVIDVVAAFAYNTAFNLKAPCSERTFYTGGYPERGKIQLRISDLFTRVNKLSVDETNKLLDKKGHDGAILLDVREPAEYEEGHIPGAQLMPLSSLLDNINKLSLSKPIVTYCTRGPRSKSAAALLKRQGFENIYYMEGGIDAWNGLAASGRFETGLFLLEGRKTPEELIILAWSLEEGTGMFYSQMKNLSDDEEAKQIFELLINAEQGHKSKLLEAYSQIKGREITDETIQQEALKGYIEGGISIEEVVDLIRKGDSKLQDVLEICMQIEANSLDLYIKILRDVDNKITKKAFNILIKDEKAHLARLGTLLGSNKQKIRMNK